MLFCPKSGREDHPDPVVFCRIFYSRFYFQSFCALFQRQSGHESDHCFFLSSLGKPVMDIDHGISFFFKLPIRPGRNLQALHRLIHAPPRSVFNQLPFHIHVFCGDHKAALRLYENIFIPNIPTFFIPAYRRVTLACFLMDKRVASIL